MIVFIVFLNRKYIELSVKEVQKYNEQNKK